jgi:hypothetical protein
MSSDKKDEEMICALTADEHVALQEGLRALPETMPPRAVWLRIREQAEAEGLLNPPAARKHTQWYAGVGLAAAALMAAVLMPGINEPIDSSISAVPDNQVTNSVDLSNLVVLQAYSRQLESNLRALPAEPRVARAGTVATMSSIKDRIAAIDYQLNDSSAEMTDTDREIFWRERVRLMKLLLQLRYAQAQRTAF